MPRLLLSDRYRGNPPTRSRDDAHAWLNADEQRFILWALRDRWSAARVGRALGVSAQTVRRCRDRYWGDPKALLDLDLFEMVSSAEKDEYRCLVCADRVKVRLQIEQHVLRHFLDQDVVDTVLPDEQDDEDDEW